MEKKRITMGEIMAYSFGLFGLQFIIGYLNSYQAQFYNKTMAADLTIISIIMLIAKLISSFADPFIGRMIDKGKFKSGKLRPFIMISTIPLFILSILIFIVVPFRGIGLYVYIFVTFTLWSIAMTFADIPSQGMLAMLSPDPMERNRVAGVSNLVKNIGLSASFVFVPLVCIITKSEGGAIGRTQFLVSAIVIATLGCGLFSLIFFKNKERVPHKVSHATMKEMLGIIKDSKPLTIVLVSALIGFGRNMCLGIQAQAAHALVGTMSLFGMQIGGENMILIFAGSLGVSAAISMIFIPMMTKKWGVKKVFIGISTYGFVVSTIVYIMYIAGITSLLSLIIGLFFVGLGHGALTFLPTIMTADCVDYYEYKTGKRTEGIHYAVLSLSVKISMAMSLAGGLFVLGLSGYDANADIFSTKTKNIIYAAYVFIPGICFLLSMIPVFFYKLDGDYKKKITEELAKRHEENV